MVKNIWEIQFFSLIVTEYQTRAAYLAPALHRHKHLSLLFTDFCCYKTVNLLKKQTLPFRMQNSTHHRDFPISNHSFLNKRAKGEPACVGEQRIKMFISQN